MFRFYSILLLHFVVSYGAEAWTMTKKEEQALIFERKVFGGIYGPKLSVGPLLTFEDFTSMLVSPG